MRMQRFAAAAPWLAPVALSQAQAVHTGVFSTVVHGCGFEARLAPT
jgi:hypothetical protein